MFAVRRMPHADTKSDVRRKELLFLQRIYVWATAALLPSAYVALLPALAHLRWGPDHFGLPDETWSISRMIKTPQANAAFATLTFGVVRQTRASPTTRAARRRGPCAALLVDTGQLLLLLGWCMVVLCPVDSLSNTVHDLGATLAAIGAMFLAVLVVSLVRLYLLAAAIVITCVPLFAVLLSVPNTNGSPRFFAAEVLGIGLYANLFPLLDLLRPGITILW